MATDIEIAWAAGFYEGEGSFGVKRNPYGHPTALRVTVAQRTEEPLLRFHAAVDLVGKVRHRLIRGADFWYYDSGRTLIALQVAQLLWHHLSQRRKDQIEVAVDEFLSVRHILEYDVAFLVENSKTAISD